MEYKRKVDKKRIPTCNIMGVNIAAINMEWLVDYLEKNISEIKGDYICVSNVHTTVTSFDDADYCAIQNGGLMAIPDGGPLSTVGQKRGHKNMERTTGPSLMGEIFEISAKKGYRHYFYGSKEETLELLYQKLTSNYPGIQIAGMYSPPFRPLTEEEDKAIIERINETKPDFVWVGIGAPKQEKWMAAHQGKIDGLMLGVGAGFDYYAENIKRAPMWMQKHNLEWVYRLVQDPKRLFKRWKRMGAHAPKLIVCGTGPMEDWCKSFIRENDVNIEMRGFVPNNEALKIIANSKALVLPTQWYEGFPMSIVEAFSVGTPVICSDLGNAGSVVEEGITGYKFTADLVDEIIQAVKRCHGLCSQTKKVYKDNYSVEKNYELIGRIYKAIQMKGL